MDFIDYSEPYAGRNIYFLNFPILFIKIGPKFLCCCRHLSKAKFYVSGATQIGQNIYVPAARERGPARLSEALTNHRRFTQKEFQILFLY
jgi:hypothetical protein